MKLSKPDIRIRMQGRRRRKQRLMLYGKKVGMAGLVLVYMINDNCYPRDCFRHHRLLCALPHPLLTLCQASTSPKSANCKISHRELQFLKALLNLSIQGCSYFFTFTRKARCHRQPFERARYAVAFLPMYSSLASKFIQHRLFNIDHLHF
jgi:hypothetical protein